ncbi:11121_t:CDS:2 [Entrophospora sp. SA101]|nr:11121_t:CDS:2 [Entrophospora sp. SA101]
MTFQNINIEEELEDPQIKDWSWLWTDYKYRWNPTLRTGAEFNRHLISTYGASFIHCLNEASSKSLEKLFKINLKSTIEKKLERNSHPIGLVMGAPGIGKTQFLLECVDHIQYNDLELLENYLVDLLLHAIFADPVRRFDNFVADLTGAGSNNVHMTLEKAIKIACKGLGVLDTDNWLIVVAIDEFDQILDRFEGDTGRKFLSELIKVLGVVVCQPPTQTTVIGLLAGTMATTMNAIFCESYHETMSVRLFPLNRIERRKILSSLDKFPQNWETCQKFRDSLADVGGLPRLFEKFLMDCQKYIDDGIQIEDWPYEEIIIPEVKSYARTKYLAGAVPYAEKLIEDTILQTPVFRESIIDPTEKLPATYGDLESRADILLVEQNDKTCIVTLPFLLLQWLVIVKGGLSNPATNLLRDILDPDREHNTWREFEVLVAMFNAIKIMFFYQRETRKRSNGDPIFLSLEKIFGTKAPPYNIILSQNVNVCRSREQFPPKKKIAGIRTREHIKWEEDGTIVLNSIPAHFVDIFTVRKTYDTSLVSNGHNYLMICEQCKQDFIDTKLTKKRIENEISKIYEAIKKHVPKYKECWVLVIYSTQKIEEKIDDERCIVLDSIGMERHFGSALAERVFSMLENQKINANNSEVDESYGIGTSNNMVKEQRNSLTNIHGWNDLKRRISKIPKNLKDRFES